MSEICRDGHMHTLLQASASLIYPDSSMHRREMTGESRSLSPLCCRQVEPSKATAPEGCTVRDTKHTNLQPRHSTSLRLTRKLCAPYALDFSCNPPGKHIHIHIHIHIYIYIHMYSHTYIYMYMHMHIPIPIYLHIYAYAPIHIYTYTHVRNYTSTNLRIYKSTHLHIHTPTHLHIYTSTHLHIYKSPYLHVSKSAYLHIYISTYLHIQSVYMHAHTYTRIMHDTYKTHTDWVPPFSLQPAGCGFKTSQPSGFRVLMNGPSGG